MDGQRDRVVYRFELPDETKLTWGVQFGCVVPALGETVVIPDIPGVFEVAGFRWRLPHRGDDGPRQPVVCAVVVRECGAEKLQGFGETDPFDGDPDGGDPRDRR